MLRSAYPEARRLTDLLRAAAAPGPRYTKADRVHEREATLQIVLEGGVLRQRFAADGKRHTVATYFPHDILNLTGYVSPKAERSDYLMAMEGTVVGQVADATVRQLRADAPEGMAVLLLHELRISQEWISRLGQRSALERAAHFLCETMMRTGGVRERRPLRMTQDMLASILGMTPVHMNRTMQILKRRNLAELVRNQLVVPSFEALADVGLFDDAYLIQY